MTQSRGRVPLPPASQGPGDRRPAADRRPASEDASAPDPPSSRDPASASARRGAGAWDLVLGRYRLEWVLGRGATSTVWLGHDERLDRPVAVKVLDDRLLADPAAPARLEREARSAARLSHPNVVGVHDVAVGQGHAALVLEYVPGRSLSERLRDGRLPVADALRIGADVASGLAAAHGLGIVHRDVKPANILLGDDGRARLADFGIATALGDAPGPEEEGVAGTLHYMAPERLEGGPGGPATDVWSLGVVLFQMLTGGVPFAGATLAELLEAVLRRTPALGLPPGAVPPTAADAVTRALEPEPSARPSAGELAEVLRVTEKGLAPAAAMALTPAQSGLAAFGDLPTQTDLVRLPARPATQRRRPVSPVMAAIAGMVAIALLAVGIGRLADGSGDQVTPPAAASPAGGGPSASTAAGATAIPSVAVPTPAAPADRGRGHGRGKGKGG